MTATSSTVDDRYVILAGIVLAIHFVTNAVHAVAHAEIPVVLDPALDLVVLLSFFLLPAVGFALLWRGSARLGAAVFTLAMAVSFVLGVYLHFLVTNPDHVSAVPPGPWQLPFQLSAAGFTATTAAGTALGAWLWRKSGRHEHASLSPTGRIEGVPDAGWRPLTRLVYRASRRRFGDVPAPLAVTAHHGRVLAGATAFEAALASSDRVDDRLKEFAVLKAATLIGCEFCVDFATAEARELGVTDDQLRALADFEESDAFSELERLVLRYAVALTATPTDVPESLFDALAAEFDEAELVELTAAVAIENYRGRFNRAFGLDAQDFSDASCPRPAGSSEDSPAPGPTSASDPVRTHGRSVTSEHVDRDVQDLGDHRFTNGSLIAWGLSYWFAVLVKPDLVGNFSPRLSAASLAILGALILGNLVLDSTVLWVVLGLFSTSGIVSSWVGFTRWTVPYLRGVAAVSMALVNALSAVVFFAKAMEE